MIVDFFGGMTLNRCESLCVQGRGKLPTFVFFEDMLEFTPQ